MFNDFQIITGNGCLDSYLEDGITKEHIKDTLIK